MIATSHEAALSGSAAPYALSVAALGALLLTGHFIPVWALVPHSVTAGPAIARVAGALMLASALGLPWRKTVVASSAVVALLFLGWLLLLQTPRLVAAPSKEGLWSGAAQLITVVAGSWTLFASVASKTEGAGRWFRGERAVRAARVAFALALPMFGLHHFFDLPGAAEAVPAWLPFKLAWAALTGVGHIAAGVAILVGIAPRLAATLETIMISLFVLLVHVPGVVGAPGDWLQWTMLVVAAAIGGAAWIVARSYGSMAWLGRQPRSAS